ncbi:MAG: hypothetical protein WCX30_03125 [Candidatus Paceibacterota bacterium]|jgi:hypothetical protein|nr:hypothetical protein [bacterium]
MTKKDNYWVSLVVALCIAVLEIFLLLWLNVLLDDSESLIAILVLVAVLVFNTTLKSSGILVIGLGLSVIATVFYLALYYYPLIKIFIPVVCLGTIIIYFGLLMRDKKVSLYG